MKSRHFNKVCQLEDFSDPEIVGIIRDVYRHEIRDFGPDFPRGAERRKYWEAATAVRALRHFGALRADATLLGVGVGVDAVPYYLTRHVKQVFAVDRYLDPGAWGRYAPGFMVVEPEKIAPYDFERNRLIVQHMDSRILRYPDNAFDAVVSLSSIEHWASLEFAANAAYEMGRVLKPDGVLALSTEFLISGPPGDSRRDSIVLFSRENLQRYIIEASGLVPVDELDTDLSNDTLASSRDLTMHYQAAGAPLGTFSRAGDLECPTCPDLIRVYKGYVFCSMHLTLRKTAQYPASSNEWARPTPVTLEAIRDAHLALHPSTVIQAQPQGMEHTAMSAQISTQTLARVRNLLKTWNIARLSGWHNRTLRRLPWALAAMARAFIRILTLGRSQEAQSQLFDAMVDGQSETVARLQELGHDVAGLNSQLDQHASQLSTLLQQVNSQAEFHLHLAKLSTQMAELDNHVRRLAGLDTRVAQIDSQLANVDAQAVHRAELEARATEIGAQLTGLVAQLARQAALETRVTEMDAQLTGLAAQASRRAELETQVAEMRAQLAELDAQAPRRAELETQVAEMRAQLAELDAQTPRRSELEARIAEAGTRLAGLDAQATRLAELEAWTDQMRSHLAELTALARRQAQLETHMLEADSRQADFDSRLRQTTSYTRLFRQRLQMSTGAGKVFSNEILNGQELVELIKTLEQAMPELARCNAIELSIQDESAEEVLMAAAAFLGDRMSSKGNPYRVPNDVWYHVDFTPEWNRHALFENAARRLAPGGKLIIVTSPDHAYPASPALQEVVADKIVTLASRRSFRICVWQPI